MVDLYVGVTDYDWFRFLSARPDLDEVNFWQPGGKVQFKALQPGELFLFKLHSPRNFIVGGGIFARFSILPVSIVWAAFGERNGAPSLEVMRQRIGHYRREAVDPRQDYSIGCRILAEPFFLPEDEWIPAPASWAPNIVSGRTYDTAAEDGRRLWDAITERLERIPFAQESWARMPGGFAERSDPVERAPAMRRRPRFSMPRFGEPMLVRPRLGQGTFRVAVTDLYGRRCAVTGEKTLPILDAAHIRPYAEGGAHELSNGLLLRTDVHRLFDLGYVTVSSDGRFEVGKRLREDFENGRHYYAMHGAPVAPPSDPRQSPSHEALEWHQNNRFLG